MKTKNNVLASLEIAIVLCSVFFVALPAIAAEQNPEMHEMSASTITTTSEDDYVLDIYGNANEDDTIDMRDLTYVKLIFFGKKSETELADAKYDGKINPLDFIQIKLIIVGKEKELTVVDSVDRRVTVKKPVKRMVVTFRQSLELLRAVKVEEDRIVGVERHVQYSGGGKWKVNTWGINYAVFFPEYQDKPTVGYIWGPDVEAILNLDPDVVILVGISDYIRPVIDTAQDVLELAGVTVFRAHAGLLGEDILDEARRIGYIFNKEDEAEEFIDFYNKYMNPIWEEVEEIPGEDKPKVYVESNNKYTAASESMAQVGSTGGKDIFDGAGGKVDPEAIMEENPDIIIKQSYGGDGYHLDAGDITGLKEIREEIMSRPALQNVNAVKTGKVYVFSGYIIYGGPSSGCRGFLQTAYQAKWFHPELFKDLDPKALHQEYLTRFQGLDIDLDKQGVFVYHPEEHPDGS
jgi:iron complex transport system substrate-binding protein